MVMHVSVVLIAELAALPDQPFADGRLGSTPTSVSPR